MGESVAFPYLACLILRTASGCDIVAVKFPGACPGFPDFKTSLTKFFLEFGKVKALHLLQYAVHGFLDFRFVDFANVLRLYKVPFLGYGIGGFRCLFPIQLSRYSSPERETRFASMCRWACSFLLSVPLCRMMMYWWFANPMRCMKSLPSSAQSASVKVALSSIEGLTSKRRQLFLRSEINVIRFHFLHHFRTSTPIKFMPGYLGGYCLPVYLFGEVVLQCRHTM